MWSNTNEPSLTKSNAAFRVGIVLTVTLLVAASVYMTKQEQMTNGSAPIQLSNKMQSQQDLFNWIGCAVPIVNPQYKTNCPAWRCAFNVGKDVMPKTANATNAVQLNLNKYAHKHGLLGPYGAYYCPNRKYASTPEITPMNWMQAMDAIFYATTNPIFSSSAIAARMGLIQAAMNLKGIGHMKVLDAVDCWGAWSLVLVHDTTTNNMWVDFRGTANVPGFISDGLILTRTYQPVIEGQLKIMSGWIQKWRSKYEGVGGKKMYGFMGYSAGVYYLTRVLINWKIWRVGIDGFGPISLDPKLYVNVRSELDCVSVFVNEKSFPPVCIKNCPRGHLFPMVGLDCMGSFGRYWGIGKEDYPKLWCATTDAFCGATGVEEISTSASTKNYDVVTHGTW